MECYTRSDDFFGEIERFVRVHRQAGNINQDRSRQATAQLDPGTIHGNNDVDTWWANDYNFVRTAAVVLRMLMLKATRIHALYDPRWMNHLVSNNSIACRQNRDLIRTEGVDNMPCPANGLNEAGRVAAYYDTQFDARKMMLHINNMQGDAGAFTETMAVVKKGERDIQFWFIITTWRVRKAQHNLGELDGFLYEAVPIVAVIYMEGNHQARDNWRQEQRPDFLRLEQLMEDLNIDDNLRRAIRNNHPEAVQDQNAAA